MLSENDDVTTTTPPGMAADHTTVSIQDTGGFLVDHYDF